MCKIPEIRLNVLATAAQLRKFNTIGDNFAAAVFLTLFKPSKKYRWSARAPFPAVICHTKDGNLAVCNAVTGKKEVIEANSFKATPLGARFEYKGHVYEAEYLNGLPRYYCKK